MLQGTKRDETVLHEVVIKSKGVGDTQTLHDGKASSVCKAEVLVIVLGDDLPGAKFVSFAHAHYRRTSQIDLPHKRRGDNTIKSLKQEGMSFREDDIRREEMPMFSVGLPQDGARHGMIGIASISKYKVC